MSDFVIISDSSCDLKKDLRERFGIADYIKGYIHKSDGTSIKANLDWSDEESNAFFKELSKKDDKYKTAAPSIGEVTDVIEAQLKTGKDALCITISSGLSGMYGVVVNATRDLKEKYPDRKVLVVDSKRYSTAQAILCILASKYRAEGMSIEETAELLEINKNRVHQTGWMDDLFYCKKMGRVSNAAAVMGTLVGIKPMADFNHKGVSHVLGKTRGCKNAYKLIIDYMKATGEDLENQTIFITHSLREEYALEVKNRIQAQIHPKEIVITTVGQGCAPNIGPGLVAAFYLGKKISEDLKTETSLFNELAQKL